MIAVQIMRRRFVASFVLTFGLLVGHAAAQQAGTSGRVLRLLGHKAVQLAQPVAGKELTVRL